MPVPNVVALISAFNEADIIGQVIEHLASEGVSVYLIDDGSEDETVREAEAYVGRGVIGIERLAAASIPHRFDWAAILRRKEALAGSLSADWFIHHDADEFRESPLPRVTLAEAIGHVDALGYNAIDFHLLNFWPTTGGQAGVGPVPERDVRQSLPSYELGEPWNRIQVKCWKNLGLPIDLASSGGHEVRFAGRNVYPLRFLLRHYPIRSDAHGRRKVFVDRLPRFLPAERAQGWHVQYEGIVEGASFVRDPGTLAQYEPIRVRFDLALRNREVEELESTLAGCAADIATFTRSVAELRSVLDRREEEAARARQVFTEQLAELTEARRILDDKEREAVHARQVIGDTTDALHAARAAVEAREQESRRARARIAEQADLLRHREAAIAAGALEEEAHRRALADHERALGEAQVAVTRIQHSLSWRVTAPLRQLGSWLGWKS